MVRGRDQRARLEAQVIAKATDGVRVRVALQKRGPQLHHQVADSAIEVRVQIRVVHLHVGKLLEADQVFADFQHAVAHAAQRHHAVRHALAQCIEARARVRPVDVRQLIPRIAVEIGTRLDRARSPAVDRAVVGKQIRDRHLERDRVVRHLLPEAAVLCEEFEKLRLTPAEEASELDVQDRLHDDRVDDVLVDGQALRAPVAEYVQHVAIVVLEVHGWLPVGRGVFASESGRWTVAETAFPTRYHWPRSRPILACGADWRAARPYYMVTRTSRRQFPPTSPRGGTAPHATVGAGRSIAVCLA